MSLLDFLEQADGRGKLADWAFMSKGYNGTGANYYQAGFTNKEAAKVETGKSFADMGKDEIPRLG